MSNQSKRIFTNVRKDVAHNQVLITDRLKIPSTKIITLLPPNPPGSLAGDIVYDEISTSLFYFDGVQWRELDGSTVLGATSINIPIPPGRLHIAAADDATVEWEPPGALNETTSNRLFLHAPDESQKNNYLIIQADNTSGISLITSEAATFGGRYPGVPEVTASLGQDLTITCAGNISATGGTGVSGVDGGSIVMTGGNTIGTSQGGSIQLSGGSNTQSGAELSLNGGTAAINGTAELNVGGSTCLRIDAAQDTNVLVGDLNVDDGDVNVAVGNVDINTSTSGLRLNIVNQSETATGGPSWLAVNTTMNGSAGKLTINFSGAQFDGGEEVFGVITNSYVTANSLIFLSCNDGSGLSRAYICTVNQIINGDFTYTINAYDASGTTSIDLHFFVINPVA